MLYKENEILNYLKIDLHKDIYLKALEYYIKEFNDMKEISNNMLKNKNLVSKTGKQIVSLIKFLKIEKTEIKLYWIAKLYYCLPLEGSWKIFYKSVNEINYIYGNNIKLKHPPYILYLFYLFQINKNISHNCSNLNKSKFHYFKNKIKFQTINLYNIYDNKLLLTRNISLKNDDLKNKLYKNNFDFLNIKKDYKFMKNRMKSYYNDTFNEKINKKFKKNKKFVIKWNNMNLSKTKTVNKIDHYYYNSQFKKREYNTNWKKNINIKSNDNRYSTATKFSIKLKDNVVQGKKIDNLKKVNLLKIKNKNLVKIDESKINNHLFLSNNNVISNNNWKIEGNKNDINKEFDVFLSKDKDFNKIIEKNEIIKNTYTNNFWNENKTNAFSLNKNKINYVTKSSFFNTSNNFNFKTTYNQFSCNNNISQIKERFNKKNLYQSYESLNKGLNRVFIGDYNPEVSFPKQINLLSYSNSLK